MIPISRRALGAALCILSLCGCEVNLYSDLDEQDATAMMAELLDQGIACAKSSAKGGWTLRVDKADLPMAVKLLANRGYPKGRYQGMGEMFKKQGLVSSPQEDRMRYIFALSQEVERTLSEIDGVIAARVHIVLPENDPLATTLKPSSASVFIKYRQGSPVRDNLPQIKQLVLNSVEGLTLDKVSVISLAGSSIDAASSSYQDLLGIKVQRDSLPILYGLLGSLGVLAGLVLYLSVLAFSPRSKSKLPGAAVPVRREKEYA